MTRFLWPAATAGVLLSAVLGLAACGGGTSATSNAAATPTATASSTPAADASGAGGRENPYADPTVQACLKAAGIAIPTIPARASGARPSGSFTRPSGSFTRPSGSFTGTRSPGAGFGGFGGTDSPEFQKIQQALTACGISLPTPSFGRGSGGGQAPGATTSPSS